LLQAIRLSCRIANHPGIIGELGEAGSAQKQRVSALFHVILLLFSLVFANDCLTSTYLTYLLSSTVATDFTSSLWKGMFRSYPAVKILADYTNRRHHGHFPRLPGKINIDPAK